MPGRLRVRMPSKRGDTSYFHEVTLRLSEHSGIIANLATGSILIRHESDSCCHTWNPLQGYYLPSIAQCAAELGLFVIEAVLDPARKIPRATAELGPMSLTSTG